MPNFEKSIYINHNFNRNKIVDVLAENNLLDNYIENWQSSTFYYVGKKVYNAADDTFYQCNVQHISGVSLSADQSKWSSITASDFRKIPSINEKGLFYFDTYINRLVVWDGDRFRIVRYLDEDSDASINENDIQLDDIWAESNKIPTLEVDAATSSILFHHQNITTVHVPNSYSFKVPVLTESIHVNSEKLAIFSIVPKEYDPLFYTTSNSFYYPVLKTFDDIVIPIDYKNWKLIGDTVTFYDGFSTFADLIIDDTHPPKITFYEYIGLRLDTVAIGSNSRIYQISGTYGTPSGSNFNLPLPSYATQTSDIVSVLVNGLIIFNNYSINTPNILTINMNGIGYTLDGDDLFYVELKLPFSYF